MQLPALSWEHEGDGRAQHRTRRLYLLQCRNPYSHFLPRYERQEEIVKGHGNEPQNRIGWQPPCIGEVPKALNPSVTDGWSTWVSDPNVPPTLWLHQHKESVGVPVSKAIVSSVNSAIIRWSTGGFWDISHGNGRSVLSVRWA